LLICTGTDEFNKQFNTEPEQQIILRQFSGQ